MWSLEPLGAPSSLGTKAIRWRGARKLDRASGGTLPDERRAVERRPRSSNAARWAVVVAASLGGRAAKHRSYCAAHSIERGECARAIDRRTRPASTQGLLLPALRLPQPARSRKPVLARGMAVARRIGLRGTSTATRDHQRFQGARVAQPAAPAQTGRPTGTRAPQANALKGSKKPHWHDL